MGNDYTAEDLKSLVRKALRYYNINNATKVIWPHEEGKILDAIDTAFAEPQTCKWVYDATHDYYSTECGSGAEWGRTFCPDCGGAIVKDTDAETERCQWKKQRSIPCECPNCNHEPDAPEPEPKGGESAELQVAFDIITELRERVRELEVARKKHHMDIEASHARANALEKRVDKRGKIIGRHTERLDDLEFRIQKLASQLEEGESDE